MKYHDKGFVEYFEDHIHLQLLNLGTVVLELTIYENKICQGQFQCIDADEFNEKYFHSSYKSDFLYNLFQNKSVSFKDKTHKIIIKSY